MCDELCRLKEEEEEDVDDSRVRDRDQYGRTTPRATMLFTV